METILIIPRELEYLEDLVKLARKKKDTETIQTQVIAVMDTLTIRRSLHQQNSPSGG
jgi:hypothetical protein